MAVRTDPPDANPCIARPAKRVPILFAVAATTEPTKNTPKTKIKAGFLPKAWDNSATGCWKTVALRENTVPRLNTAVLLAFISLAMAWLRRIPPGQLGVCSRGHVAYRKGNCHRGGVDGQHEMHQQHEPVDPFRPTPRNIGLQRRVRALHRHLCRQFILSRRDISASLSKIQRHARSPARMKVRPLEAK